MAAKQPTLSAFLESMPGTDESAEPRPFDRMMFDACGEVNHVRRAVDGGPDALDDAIRSFDRSCARIYADPAVTAQRKQSLRIAEWVLKSWCLWGDGRIRRRTATRWFDSWQRERNMSLLQL